MKRSLLIASLVFFSACASKKQMQSTAALTPALKLLNESIAFHDPKNNWDEFSAVLNFKVELPEKDDMRRTVTVDNKRQRFTFEAPYDEGTLIYTVEGDQGNATWNGKSEIPEEFAEKYRINTDRAIMYRDYYLYLYGMPMKLKDPGTVIDPEVKQVEFYGKTYDRIRATYNPEVGEDIWYFYFNPSSHALEAYQFFHDESKNDGEYILFEELVELDRIKIPRLRKWYYNKDKKFLATDVLLR